MANLKKRNIDKLATAPAEIYAMVRGEYKAKIPRYQHFSILLVTWSRARHQLRKSSCKSGRTEVFDLPPSAATHEFRETFLQPPPKQAQNTAKLMADVTVDEVRDRCTSTQF